MMIAIWMLMRCVKFKYQLQILNLITSQKCKDNVKKQTCYNKSDNKMYNQTKVTTVSAEISVQRNQGVVQAVKENKVFIWKDKFSKNRRKQINLKVIGLYC